MIWLRVKRRMMRGNEITKHLTMAGLDPAVVGKGERNLPASSVHERVYPIQFEQSPLWPDIPSDHFRYRPIDHPIWYPCRAPSDVFAFAIARRNRRKIVSPEDALTFAPGGMRPRSMEQFHRLCYLVVRTSGPPRPLAEQPSRKGKLP
jgi:hypothetical protein